MRSSQNGSWQSVRESQAAQSQTCTTATSAHPASSPSPQQRRAGVGTRDGFCGLEEPLASACAPLVGDSITLVLEAEKCLFAASAGAKLVQLQRSFAVPGAQGCHSEGAVFPPFQIFLEVPLHVCEQRHVNRLQRSRSCRNKDFPGINPACAKPEAPELVLETDLHHVKACVQPVWEPLQNQVL
uniref:APS kinase domain-containing protein n=1 Tax=Molossus molossus TaxID=27622 RepID=A0A7J8CRM4_MOLMO|nr:hypothetical protein HJG59_009729 [Molossus molossus]